MDLPQLSVPLALQSQTSSHHLSYTNNDENPEFSQQFYDRIEEFLDNEKLHITCPQTPHSVKPTKLKMCPNLQRLRSLCESSVPSSASTNDGSSSMKDEDFKDMAMPSFLLKRTMSSNCINVPNRPAIGNLMVKRGVHSDISIPRSRFLLMKSLVNEEDSQVQC